MFDQITREHILSAFEQADKAGIDTIRTNYVLYNGQRYPVKQIVRLAYLNAYGTPAREFISNVAIPVLVRCGFETLRTDGPLGKNQIASSSYTWVPFYREMCAKLHQYAPDKLINILQELKIDGLRDKSLDGTHDMILDDIDPYTFLSFINKFGNTNRLAYLGQLRPLLDLTIPVPTDVDGIPTAQAQSVWMFGYKYKRQPDDIDKLKALYQQVHDNALTASLFEDVLKIYKVGPAKLTEVLFYQNPDMYLPVNAQTKPWLKKRGLPFRYETFAEYQQILEAVRQYDSSPFYKISHEAYLENTAESRAAQIRYYCVGTTFGDQGDQLIRFIKEGIWQNGYGDEREQYLDIIRSIPVGAKLAAKSSFTRGPRNDSESVLEVKAIGEVTANNGNGQTLEVVWDEDVEPFTLVGKGYYRKTVQQVTRTEDIQLIFFHESAKPVELMSLQKTNHAKNIILYGPPGTGKTYETIDLAVGIIDGHNDSNHKVNKDRFDVLQEEGRIEFVTFHQNYTYEDFVIGLKPDVNGETDGLRFERREGVFYRISKRARENFLGTPQGGQVRQMPFEEVVEELLGQLANGQEISFETKTGVPFKLTGVSDNGKAVNMQLSTDATYAIALKRLKQSYEGDQATSNSQRTYYEPIAEYLRTKGEVKMVTPVEAQNYVLIIDEINRANMSRVFGELITLLEDDKRLGGDNALTVSLSSGESFSVPPNLYLIGTMNTADKSLALLDVALRRRFEFIGKYPNYKVVNGPARDVLERLNKAILAHHKPADFLIGHAYFIDKQPEQLPSVFNNRVIPLLMEYFNGRTDLVKTLLADAGISSERHPLTDQLTVDHVG